MINLKSLDSDGSQVDSGTSSSGSFFTSALKSVGQYSLVVEEGDCDDTSLGRTVDKTVPTFLLRSSFCLISLGRCG
jgi:hypothetical protein